ncbi:MAG: aldo/keto reductase [Myxococcota bacterium]
METRFLGRTGVRVSRLVLGTMTFGREADEATSRAVYTACRDAGVDTFDCANVYAGGESERILGRLAAGERDQLVLTTKAYFPVGKGPNERGSSRYHLVRSVEASLKRLGTDRVDVLFLHRWDERTDLEESLRAVEDLVRQGKVLYPAVSNFAAWQTMKALGVADRRDYQPVVAMQPMYNLVKRQAEVELFPLAESEGLGVLPYSPLAGGLLTGKYGAEGDARGRFDESTMYATRYGEAGYRRVAGAFTAFAKERGIHPVSLAIAWVAHHPAVTAPLLGARNVEQLAPALRALDVGMDDALYAEVAALSPAPPPATDRSEELVGKGFGAR